MKELWLNEGAVTHSLGWRRLPDGDEAMYTDRDGFNTIDVVAAYDNMAGWWRAVVLFGGRPMFILYATDGDYRYAMMMEEPGDDTREHEQYFAAFLVAIGELHEDAINFVAEGGTIDTMYDEYGGDGHEYVAFAGMVADALHEAFPDETPEPKGW